MLLINPSNAEKIKCWEKAVDMAFKGLVKGSWVY